MVYRHNQLFINQGDNTFKERAAELGLDDPGNSVDASFFDFDNDGDLDVYVANYPITPFEYNSHHYKMRMDRVTDLETDNLYRNDGGKFTKITQEAGVKLYSLSLSVTASDVNEDGWVDLYISNDFSSPDCLYINQKDGTFKNDIKSATAHTSFYGMGVDIADFNNDGHVDIVQMDMDAASRTLCKYRTRYLNNDGYKDIFVSNGTRREINNKDYFESLKGEKKHEDSLLVKSLNIPSEPIDNYVFKNNGDLTFSKNNTNWGFEDKGYSNGAVYD